MKNAVMCSPHWRWLGPRRGRRRRRGGSGNGLLCTAHLLHLPQDAGLQLVEVAGEAGQRSEGATDLLIQITITRSLSYKRHRGILTTPVSKIFLKFD